MLENQVKEAFITGIKKDWSNSILQLRKIKEIANHAFSPASEMIAVYETLDQEELDDIITSNLVYFHDEITETFTQKAPVFALEAILQQDLETAKKTRKISSVKLQEAFGQYGHKLPETVSIKPIEQNVQRMITSEGDIFYYRCIENKIFFKYDSYGSLLFKFHDPDFYEAIVLAVTPKYQQLVRNAFSDIIIKIISLREQDINQLIDTLLIQHSADIDAIVEQLKQRQSLRLDGVKQQMFSSLHTKIEQTYSHSEQEIAKVYNTYLTEEERDFTVEHNWLLLQQEVNTLVTTFDLKSLESFFVFIHDPELFLGLLLAFDDKYRGILTGILKKIYCILFPPFYLDKDGDKVEMFAFSQKIYEDYLKWIGENKANV